MPIEGAIRFDSATPHELRGGGPIVCDDGTVVVAAARLDNHDELLAALGCERDANDTTIVARAFAKWRDDSPRHLFGDWAFAAWDPNARRLFLARDHYGMATLYYSRTADTFAFATNRKPLFAHVGRVLDVSALAKYLADDPDGTSTLHENIVRLPPAHQLTATVDSCRVVRYWKMEDAPRVRFRRDDDYVERFLELYRAAVRSRLRSPRPVASTLSSGLDSSSVTALAARELRTLAAYTSVPLFPDVASEWPLAHATAEWCGNVEHHAVASEEMTPIKAIDESLALQDEPIFMARHLPWALGIIHRCRDAGAGVLLVAHMGNGAGSWAGVRRRWPWQNTRALRMRTLMPRIHPFGTFWSEMAAGFGIEVCDPSADARLVEFCVGVPEEQFARPPHNRWLMRRAVEGLIPPDVQWNTTHGRQGADLPLRLRADAANVNDAMAEIVASPAANEHLDLTRMQARWKSLQGELGPHSFKEASELMRTLLVGRFLARGFRRCSS